MFTNITVNNFKGINRLSFSPKEKDSFIYGENGSGKSALVDSLYFILKSMRTLYDERRVYSLPSRLQGLYPELSSDDLEYRVRSENEILSEMLRRAHRLDSPDGPSFKISFEINGNKGEYSASFSLSEIIKESLSFEREGKLMRLFDIEKENVFISSAAFTDAQYKDELLNKLESFLGTHSLMAILYSDLMSSSSSYYRRRVNNDIASIVDFFASVSLFSEHNKIEPMSFRRSSIAFGFSDNLSEKERKEIEKMLEFYRPYILPDYSKIYYRTFIANGRELYELVLEKNGVVIPYAMESKGIKKLIELFPYFISALLGRTAIIDDIDAALSSRILLPLLLGLEKEGEGEVIATFSSDALFKNFDKNSVFNINSLEDESVIELYNGKDKKAVKSINENRKLLLEIKDLIK